MLILYTHTHGDILKDNKIRESNFELLRIVSMIFIIGHHYALYSGFTFSENISINKLIVQFLTIGGKVGVNIFIIITGYFMVNGRFKIKKILNLALQTFTYTFIFLIVNFFIGSSFNIKDTFKSIFPVIYSQYWFITDYIVIYMFSPFINKFINSINKNDMEKLILMLIIIFSVMPTLILAKFEISNLIWFLLLYLIGAYINKYYQVKNHSKRNDIIITILSYLLIFVSIMLFDVLSNKISLFARRELHFASMNSILVLISSIFIFLTFKNIKIKKSKFINKVASTSLGIYIIHENIFMRNIIWKRFLKCIKYVNSNYFIISSITSIAIVFIIASLIEFLRQETIGKFQDKMVEKLLKKIKSV